MADIALSPTIWRYEVKLHASVLPGAMVVYVAIVVSQLHIT